MKQTAVEWLYEKLEYVNWMRNRDEISAGMADEWRKHYLEQAKAMEKEHRKNDFREGWYGNKHKDWNCEFYLQKHLNETFKSE